MNKVKFISLILLSLSLVGCQASTHPIEPPTSHQKPSSNKKLLTYSNLMDAQTQEEVQTALLSAGVSQDAISLFLKNVNTFNTKVGMPSAFHEGYTTLGQLEVDYSDVDYQGDLDEGQTFQMDLNCRLTAFELLKDFITYQTLDNEANNYLMYDVMQLDENPDLATLKPYQKGFITLFNPIDVLPNTSQAEHATAIKEGLIQKGFTFSTEDNLALINIYLHDPVENVRFVGHTGVMVTTDEGLLFIEKIGACLPYQVSKFTDESSLVDYLLSRSDLVGDGTENAPIITKNLKVIHA